MDTILIGKWLGGENWKPIVLTQENYEKLKEGLQVRGTEKETDEEIFIIPRYETWKVLNE